MTFLSEITFEPKITLSTIIELTGLVCTAIALYVKIEKRIVSLEDKVGLMFEWWKKTTWNGRNKE
jgi:hypothetical protein